MRPSSFFSSSSSSSATTTTTTSPSVDGKAYNSKNSSPGCLTGVLRRLLCLNSLPTYPRDHFKEEEKQPLVGDKLQCLEAENYPDDFNTPGVVARLMGLESRPPIMEKSPNSIGRSQSMNAIQSLTKLKSIQGRHQHGKSFREISSYKELEDESFFIISFESADEIWQGMNSGQKKQTKKDICKNSSGEKQNKENQDANKVSKGQKQGNLIDSEEFYINYKVSEPSNVLKNSCQKSYRVFELVDSNHKGRGRRRRRRRRKKVKSEVTKLETGYDSKDSSPNSVLNFAEFPSEPDPDAPDSVGAVAGEVSRLANSKFQRTLSEELENHRKAEKRRLISDDYDPRSKEKWDVVCQLVERETLQSNWIFKEILKEADDFQEIGRYLGLQILDQLLAELLNNLLENPIKKFDLPP